MKHLRDYQVVAVDAICEELKTRNSTLLVQATGLGKTVVATEVIRKFTPARTLFLAHRAELIYQAKDRIERFTGLSCEVEMAQERANRAFYGKAQVIVSSVQTQYARDHKRAFKPEDFGLLVVDEAHHYIAPAFRKVIEHYRQNPNLKVLGLTATPNRTDEAALGEIFESCAHKYEIIDGVRDGYLVDIEQMFVPVHGLDYSHVRTTCGDLNQADLARVIEEESTIQEMILPTLEIVYQLPFGTLRQLPVPEWKTALEQGKPRRTLIFCGTVKQAEAFSNIINRAMPNSADFVCEKTPKDDRKLMLRRFAAGELTIVSNVAVLGEGFDDPGVEIIVQAKATESLVVYTQQIGRATRPLSGIIDGISVAEDRKSAITNSAKPKCAVVDFVGNAGKHKLISSIDVLGGEDPDEVLEQARKNAKQSIGFMVGEFIAQTAEEIAKAKEEARRRREAERAKIVAKSEYAKVHIDIFDACGMKPRRPRGWEQGKELTEAQNKIIVNVLKLNPDLYTYTQKKQIIDEQFRRWEQGLCTVTQALQLKQAGKDVNVSELEAARLLGVPCVTIKMAGFLKFWGYDPFDFTFRTAQTKIAQIKALGGRPPEDGPRGAPIGNKPPQTVQTNLISEPAKPVGLSEAEVKWMMRYHYSESVLVKLSKEEGKRLKMRLIKNNFKPLPNTDPDHPRNYRTP